MQVWYSAVVPNFPGAYVTVVRIDFDHVTSALEKCDESSQRILIAQSDTM